MNEENTPSIEMVSLKALRIERGLAATTLSNAKHYIANIDAELVRRFFAAGGEKLAGLGKESGTTTLDVENGPKLKVSISKTVKWDSDILAKLAAEMDWEKASHYFKIVFSVKEALFNATEPGPLKDGMRRARTVKTGDMKIEFAD